MVRKTVVRWLSLVRFHWKNLMINPYGHLSAGIPDGWITGGVNKSFFQSCNSLPYEIFKTCFVEKTYELLGQGDKDYLEGLWLKHYSEFCVISQDKDVEFWLEDYVKVVDLESKIHRSRLFATMLLDGYTEVAVKNLKKLGFRYSFTAESYLDDIEGVVNKIKNMESNLKLLTNDLKKKQGSEEVSSVTYDVFDRNINAIEEIFKYPINIQTLSAQMYGIKLASLNRYISKMEAADGTD